MILFVVKNKDGLLCITAYPIAVLEREINNSECRAISFKLYLIISLPK